MLEKRSTFSFSLWNHFVWLGFNVCQRLIQMTQLSQCYPKVATLSGLSRFTPPRPVIMRLFRPTWEMNMIPAPKASCPLLHSLEYVRHLVRLVLVLYIFSTHSYAIRCILQYSSIRVEYWQRSYWVTGAPTAILISIYIYGNTLVCQVVNRFWYFFTKDGYVGNTVSK